MWRLWHRLFGWHYVSIKFGYDHYIRRVQTDGDGRPYVWLCYTHVDLKSKPPSEWHPLTFPRAAVTEAGDAADVTVLPRRKAI